MENLSPVQVVKRIEHIDTSDFGIQCSRLGKQIAALDVKQPVILAIARNGLFVAHHVCYEFGDLRPTVLSIDPHLFRKKPNEITLAAQCTRDSLLAHVGQNILRKHVIVVDGVHSTGASLNTVIKILRNMSPERITTACVYSFTKDSSRQPDIVQVPLEESNDKLWLKFAWEL